MDDDRYDALVGSLYEVSLASTSWEDVLPRIATECDANNIHLMVWDPTHPSPSFSLAPGMNHEIEAAYAAYYGAIDPRRLLVAQRSTGQWMACHHHFDAHTVGHSEFFQDYLIPGDIRYLLGTRLAPYGRSDIFLGLHRAPGREPFSAVEIDFMQRISGHFQRATHLWLHTERLRSKAALGERAVDSIEIGVVATDADGSIRYANRYAEALLREAALLRTRDGKLMVLGPLDTQRLHAVLREVATTRRPQSLGLGRITKTGGSTVQLALLPMAVDSPVSRPLNRPTVLVLISDRRHRRTASAQQLERTFGFSRAEARLARALCSGISINSYAESAGVSTNTVKSQMKQVFLKTGTSRQAELLALIANMPVVRESAGGGAAPAQNSSN